MIADDVSAIAQASEEVERFLQGAAQRGDWPVVMEAIRLLKRRTKDPRATFRDAPTRALQRIGDDGDMVDGLAREWKDGDEQTQAQLEEALSASPGIAGQLLDCAIRECSAELMLLADRVGALTEGRVDALAHDTRVPLVRAFVAALRESQRPTATIERWLALMLQHTEAEPRLLAVQAAAERGGPVAERLGRLALGDRAEEVRVAAVRALGRAHRREVLPDLSRALDEGSVPEQVAAAEALGELGIPASVTILGNVFERAGMFRKERGPLQEAAAAALARLPSNAARDLLRTLVADRNRRIADIAASAVAAFDGVAADEEGNSE
jgi:HEAT repeat protein